MPNHVHLILAPDSEDVRARSLRGLIYARRRGSGLLTGTFGAVAMDEPRLAAFRFLTPNPVRAKSEYGDTPILRDEIGNYGRVAVIP